MAIVQFSEIGGAYAAKHAFTSYYRRSGQSYDPKKLTVNGRRLYVPPVPSQVLDSIVRNIEPRARILV